ncbi:hypothetical protein F2Q68_00026308 [Brassica cretica]|uniref:Uncharacterized protein n=1 Tax=Brassica cretica TaxID=69181 RepID=A0A8S9I7X4_BRACR|nr:hypothetical protein F2Q68_00026308 [Brassica cretica]
MEVKKKGSFTFEIKLKDVMESPTLLQAGIHTTQMARLRFTRSDWTGQTDGQGAAKRMRWRGNRPNSGWRWREDGIWLAGLMSLSSWINGWDGVKNRHKFEPAGIGTRPEPRSHVEMVRPDLLDGFRETESYGPGSTPDSRTMPNYGNLYLDGRIKHSSSVAVNGKDKASILVFSYDSILYTQSVQIYPRGINYIKITCLSIRDGNQGPGPRAWTGSKRDGSKAGRVQSGTGRKWDGSKEGCATAVIVAVSWAWPASS